MINILKSEKLHCLLFVLFGALFSAILQQEVVWDFVNYHFFNAWAFVNNRVGQDVLVAGLNGFFNPLPDIPLYYLILYFNDYPVFIYFMQGLWFGGLLWLYYKIAKIYFNQDDVRSKLQIFLTLFVAVSANATYLQIGTSTNEIQLSFLVTCAIYLLLKEIFVTKTGDKKPFMISACLLGLAFGLKYTFFYWIISVTTGLFIFHKDIKNFKKNICYFAIFGVLSFLLAAGAWLLKMWEMYENPFFPFLNKFFESDWLSKQNFRDGTLVPKSAFDYLLWPFINSFTLHREEGMDMFVVDFRQAIVYLILIAYVIVYAIKSILKKNKPIENKWWFLFWITITSYILWMSVFSISRYFVIGEFLISLYIVKVLLSFQPKKIYSEIIYGTVFVLTIFVLFSTVFFSQDWGKRKNYEEIGAQKDKYFYVEDINFPENSLIKTYNLPSSAFIAYWGINNPSIKGVNLYQYNYIFKHGLGMNIEFFSWIENWRNLRKNTVLEHKCDKFILIKAPQNITPIEKINLLKEIMSMQCKKLVNNMVSDIYLCADKNAAQKIWPEGEKFMSFEELKEVFYEK